VHQSFNQKCEAAKRSDHHIRVISEGSCGTEDWSNDDDKFNCSNFSQFYCIDKKKNALA